MRATPRSRRRRGAFSWLAVLSVAGLAAALTLSPRGTAPTGRPVFPVVTKEADGLVSWRGPLHTPHAFDTPAGLYLGWDTTRLGDGQEHGVLARVDPLTGKLLAIRRVQGSPVTLVPVHRELVALLISGTPRAPGARLVEMDPGTLKPTRSSRLPAAPGYSMAVAGGGLWIAAGSVVERVAPASGKVTASLTLGGAASVSLGTDAAGSVLVAAVDASAGTYVLKRIDPLTGRVERTSPPALGTAAVGAIVQTALWLGVGAGTMGMARRYDVTTLLATGPGCPTGAGTPSCVLGTGPHPTVEGGRLYITTASAAARNYCALPSGQVVTRLPIDVGRSTVLAIGPTSLFFTVTSTTPRAHTISEVRIPAACR